MGEKCVVWGEKSGGEWMTGVSWRCDRSAGTVALGNFRVPEAEMQRKPEFSFWFPLFVGRQIFHSPLSFHTPIISTHRRAP